MNDLDITLNLNNSTNTLSPETLDASVFCKLILAFEKLVVALNEPGDEVHEVPALAITSVTKGSANGNVRVAKWAALATTGLMLSISQDKLSEVPSNCREYCSELYRLCSSNGLRMHVSSQDTFDFEISESKPIVFPRSPVYKAHNTRLYGELEEVGGEKPSARLRLYSTGRQFKLNTSEAIAKELGGLLYKSIGVVGTASINIETKEMVYFDVQSILPYRGYTSPLDDLADIRAAYSEV